MASRGNQHCANCAGTLSFPMVSVSKAQYRLYQFTRSVFSFLRQLTTWQHPHLLLRAGLRRGCC